MREQEIDRMRERKRDNATGRRRTRTGTHSPMSSRISNDTLWLVPCSRAGKGCSDRNLKETLSTDINNVAAE